MSSRKGLDGHETWSRQWHHNQLRNAISRIDNEGFAGIEVDESNADLATISSVDGSGRIDDRYPMFSRKSTAGNHEGNEAVGQSDRKPCSHRGPRPGLQRDGIGRCEVGPRVAGMSNRRRIFSGKENLNVVSHAFEVSKDAERAKSWSDRGVLYRETLWPHPFLYLAFCLEVPIILLLVAPFSLPLGISLSCAIFIIIAVAITVTSPRIEVANGILRVGKASIGLEYVGAASAFAGAHAVAERGTNLDARAWTRFRAWIGPVVRLEIIDEADPTPYWLFSTRRPQELVAVLRAARVKKGS